MAGLGTSEFVSLEMKRKNLVLKLENLELES